MEKRLSKKVKVLYILVFCFNDTNIVLFFSLGWVDCWTMPIVALSINFTYHPIPVYGPPPQADITTPEKEEKLLSPMRMQFHKAQNIHVNWCRVSKTE